MSYAADHHIGRQVVRRAEVLSIYDDGDLQLVDAMGLAGERFRRAHRMQSFGFSSSPPVGSHAALLTALGRPEQAFMIGAEMPAHRPRDLNPGESVLYNAHGDVVSLIKRNVRIVSPRVDLGGTNGARVLTEAGPSDKVFAVV